MKSVGERSKCYGLDNLQPVGIGLSHRPTEMPQLPEGHILYAIYEGASGEEVAICETLEHIQGLWNRYARGGLITLKFGSTDNEVGTYSALEQHLPKP